MLAALAMPAAAGAADDRNYASWGWSEPAGPHVDFQWGEAMPPTRLRWHARRYYRIFSEDRERECPAAYEFRPLPIEDSTVAGRNGVRYGFIVVDGDGRTVERNVSFATLTRSDLVIVAAEGLTSKACIGGEGEIFRPAELRSFSAFLAQLAADGRLPR